MLFGPEEATLVADEESKCLGKKLAEVDMI
jgi:hypothetical protein